LKRFQGIRDHNEAKKCIIRSNIIMKHRREECDDSVSVNERMNDRIADYWNTNIQGIEDRRV